MLNGKLKIAILVQSLITAVLISLSALAQAEASRWNIGLETGAVWQGYNDVQIPGNTGTQYSLSDLVGDGPLPFYRIELFYDLTDWQQLRFLIAPLTYTEDGEFAKDVDFNGQSISSGENTEATYKFNSYRISYRYLFFNGPKWRWHAGGTLKIRDAEIALQQPGVSASNSNVGVVPLLNFYGEYRLADKWQFIVDFDGLAAPQGRALDLGLKVNYDMNRNWYLGTGLRFLEGGADNDKVYNFAQFNYATISAGYQFN